MDNDSKSKLKDILSTIDPVEFQWTEDTTNSPGVIAEEISTITLGAIGSDDTITLNGNSGYSIAAGQTIAFDASNINWNSNYTIGSGISAGNTDYGSNEIRLGNGKTIDLDELHDIVETIKQRLLILTPNFEQMEKYPMLKELYNEYKAMEKLLSGPDNTPEDI